MTDYARILVIPAADQTGWQNVFEAMGYGPAGFGRALRPAGGGATSHYMMNDASLTDAEVTVLSALAAGTLPTLDRTGNAIDWDNAPISALDALTLASSGGLQLFCATNCDGAAHLPAVLDALSLEQVPDGPPDL